MALSSSWTLLRVSVSAFQLEGSVENMAGRYKENCRFVERFEVLMEIYMGFDMI